MYAPGHPDVPRQSLPRATCEEEQTVLMSCVQGRKDSRLKMDQRILLAQIYIKWENAKIERLGSMLYVTETYINKSNRQHLAFFHLTVIKKFKKIKIKAY